MEKRNSQKRIAGFCVFAVVVIVPIFFKNIKLENKPIPETCPAQRSCPLQISKDTITPLHNTKHLLVSAYMDQRLKGFDIRIIGIFKRDSIEPLYCVFCCAGNVSATTPATISQHSDNFGFPFVTTDVMCSIPENCNPAHVTLVTKPERDQKSSMIGTCQNKHSWLPIQNLEKEKKFKVGFTVCLSVLFGGYNNVLQVVQTLEMYRLLGVDRVVVYNNSIGPDLDRLLQSYSQEGFVEVVQWPIHKYLNPSPGWLFSRSGGDMHYHGQQTVINECIYRSMDRSEYVLQNDIDEIIMPYQHNSLSDMMKMLQQQNPKVTVFVMENHIFSTNFSDPSETFKQWKGVPGINILDHIFTEVPKRNEYSRSKMIIDPRAVEQVSVHGALAVASGETYKVPREVGRMIHIRLGTQQKRDLAEDKRLWSFSKQLIPNVNEHLKRAGLQRSANQR